MTTFEACSIVEGFCDYEPTNKQILEAWSQLIKSGDCWNLQGFYGRGASNLIKQGIINSNGEINWSKVE